MGERANTAAGAVLEGGRLGCDGGGQGEGVRDFVPSLERTPLRIGAGRIEGGRCHDMLSYPHAVETALFGARGDLVRMQIMQIELIDQCLLDFFVHDQESIDLDLAAFVGHRLGQVTIDIDRFSILTIAGEIRDIVRPVEFLHAPQDGVQRAVEHEA